MRRRILAALAVVVAGVFLVAVPSSSGAATPTWQAPVSVDPFAGNLTAISCPTNTTTWCSAVDAFGGVFTFSAGKWSTRSTIDTNRLSALSCPVAGSCVAVDERGQAIVEKQNVWSAPVSIGLTPGNGAAVSCATATYCVVTDSDGKFTVFNGTTWTAPATADAASGGLLALSCPVAKFCAAVGSTTHLLTFNGTTWTVNASSFGHTPSVSCASTTFCVAVNTNNQASIFRGRWGQVSTVNNKSTNIFDSISCVSTNHCVALAKAGYLSYNGLTWTAPTAEPAGVAAYAIDCSSTKVCAYLTGGDSAGAINGATMAAPTVIDPTHGGPTALSCSSPVFCALLDESNAAEVFDTSGSHMTYGVQSPDVGGTGTLSCAADAYCTGGGTSLTGLGTLIRYINGTWTATPQNPGFVSLSCPSTDECVGAQADGTVTFITGSGSVDNNPLTAMPLTSVSCADDNHCTVVDSAGEAASEVNGVWAAAQVIDADPGPGPMHVACPSTAGCVATDASGNAFTYYGGTWSAAKSIDPAHRITAVDCAKQTATCMAVDEAGNAISFHNGTWAAPVAIDTTDPTATLTAVSCPTATFCLAVASNGDAIAYH